MESEPLSVRLSFSVGISTAQRSTIEQALVDGGLTVAVASNYETRSAELPPPQLLIEFENAVVTGGGLMLGGLAVTTAWRVASAALKQGVRAARRLVAGIQVAIRVDAPAHHGHYVLPEESEDDDAIDGLLRSFERGGNDWYFWDAPNGEWQASSERKGRPKE